jgi:hypothetical protein
MPKVQCGKIDECGRGREWGRTSVEAVGEDLAVLGEAVVSEDPVMLSEAAVTEAWRWTWRSRHM